MKLSRLISSGLLVAMSNPMLIVEGRQWQTIVDYTIGRKSDIDGQRYQLTIEADPFFFPQDNFDDEVITDAPQASVWVTLSPTLAPSSVPSDSPSLTPTAWDIDKNGGCRFGLDLYEIHMYDSWGDGWDQTMIKITGFEDQDPIDLPTSSMTRTVTDQTGDVTVSISRTVRLDSQSIFKPEQNTEVDPLGVIFQGGLRRGSHDFSDLCLVPKRCYEVIVAGGEFLNEVSWDIRPADVEYANQSTDKSPILAGGAPAWCTFSLPDENGHHFCPNSCSGTLPPSAMTEAPNVLENLQQNFGGSDTNAYNQDVGGEYSQNLGTTRSYGGSSGIGEGMNLDGVYGSGGGSSFLSKFTRVQDEDSNN